MATIAVTPNLVPVVVVPVFAPKLNFFHRFLHGFEVLFGHAPAWEHAAITVVNFAAPFAMSVITLYAPELLPVALPIINTIKADLATLYVITGDGTQHQSAALVIHRIQTNFKDLLTAAAVKNPAQQDKLTATVNLIVGEFDAVLGMLPVVPTPTA